MVAPATYFAALAVWAIRRGLREPALWALAANWLAFVALLPREGYDEYIASSRNTLGVVVAAVLAVPALAPLLRRTRGWLLTPAVAWFLPWAVLLVFAFRRTWT